MAQNFHGGARWISGTVIEHISYVVQVQEGVCGNDL